jgi:hypothetical protein
MSCEDKKSSAKHILLTLLLAAFHYAFSQNSPPVAVNDTVYVTFNEEIVIPVLANDYDPDGDPIHIVGVGNAEYISYNDSTVTAYFTNKYTDFSVRYAVEDLYGNLTGGKIIFKIQNKEYIDINNIRAIVNPFGNQFWDFNSDAGFEYPKGSGNNISFKNALWIGGKDAKEQLHLAAETSRKKGYDYSTGPVSGDGNTYDSTQAYRWNRVWKINKEEIIYHTQNWYKEDYEIPEAIASWPAGGSSTFFSGEAQAPFLDYDRDGLYNPEKGDYPWIKGDQCIYFVFNDLQMHSESSGKTLGIEVQGMVWGIKDESKDFLNNCIFINYQITNTSETDYTDTYLGLFLDANLVDSDLNRLSCDVQRGSVITKGVDVSDTLTFSPTSVGVALLGGAKMDNDKLDNPGFECNESINGIGFGDGIIDNERFGLTHFITFRKEETGDQGTPLQAHEFYNYLQANWKDGSPLEYGGFGTFETGAYGPECHFMFPMDSDPCYWGTYGQAPNGSPVWEDSFRNKYPKPKNSLASSGPFTFKSHSTEEIDYAFVCAEESNPSVRTKELLNQYIDSIRIMYNKDPKLFGHQYLSPEPPPQPLSPYIFPNPAQDLIHITLPEYPKSNQISIYDLSGRLVWTKDIPSILSYKINIRDFKPGFYLLKLISNENVISEKFIKR